MYKILQSAHSGWRWVVLIALVYAIVKLHIGWRKKNEFKEGDRKLALFGMIFFHIQYLLGLVIYFISPKVNFIPGMMKDAALRFYGVEHIVMMTIAFVLITIGHSKSKKKENDTARFKTLAIFYTIALIIVLAAIPWPFRAALGGSWA